MINYMMLLGQTISGFLPYLVVSLALIAGAFLAAGFVRGFIEMLRLFRPENLSLLVNRILLSTKKSP